MGSGTEVFKYQIILKFFKLFVNPSVSGRINLSSNPNLQHPPEHGQTRRQTRCSFHSALKSTLAPCLSWTNNSDSLAAASAHLTVQECSCTSPLFYMSTDSEHKCADRLKYRRNELKS